MRGAATIAERVPASTREALAALRADVATIEQTGRRARPAGSERNLRHRAALAANTVRVVTDASDEGMRALAHAAGVEFWAVMWLADHDGLPADWSPDEAADFLDAVELAARGRG